jgi:uncharacterized protein YndB with AHSA1/START domain
MRWALGIAGCLAALLMVCGGWLVVASRRQDTGRYYADVTIARPPAVIIPYFTDTEKMRQWIEGFAGAASGDRELTRRDAVARVVMNAGGKPWPFDVRVLEYDPPRRFRSRLANPEFDMITTAEFEQHGAATRLRYWVDTEYHNALYRLLEPLAASQAQAKLEADLARLKARVEAGP